MTGRRKILHLTSACTVGGAEAHVLALLGRLDPARYELWLAYFEERPDRARPMMSDFRALGVRLVDLRGRGQLDPGAILRLAGLMRVERFDLVHAHSLRAEVAAVVAAALCRPSPRLVRSVHNTDDFYQRPATAWLPRLTCRRLDRIVAISDAVAAHLLRHGRVPAHKVRRIYYGLDPAPYAAVPALSSSSETRPHVIGMIARLAPQKGHAVLLEALPDVFQRFPDLRVELVGHEHLTTLSELEAQARRLGIGEQIHFTGFRDDLPTLLGRWDLLVLPSLWEGFGLVLLEAMAAGRPVVATRVGPIPEIVIDGETGLLVPPGQPRPLAAAIIALLAQPQLAASMGAAGRRRVSERFTLTRMVAQIEELYAELARPGQAVEPEDLPRSLGGAA